MALRIKCKCGKSLKIPSSFADKKIACPACKRPFRIAASKFKTAAASAPPPKPQAKKPAAAPSETPVPAPVELNIAPSNIDLDWSGEIEHSQSDILGDLPEWKPPEANTLKACPSCDKALPIEAKLCVNCGYDLRTGETVSGAKNKEAGPGLQTSRPAKSKKENAGGGGLKGLMRKFIGKSEDS